MSEIGAVFDSVLKSIKGLRDSVSALAGTVGQIKQWMQLTNDRLADLEKKGHTHD